MIEVPKYRVIVTVNMEAKGELDLEILPRQDEVVIVPFQTMANQANISGRGIYRVSMITHDLTMETGNQKVSIELNPILAQPLIHTL